MGSRFGKRRHEGCLPFIKKKNSRNFGRSFRSVRKVRVVYHLPKISGLSRRARRGSSYNMKLARNSCKEHVNGKRISIRNFPTGKTRLPFQNFRLSQEFSSGTNYKNVCHLHPNRNFREFVKDVIRFQTTPLSNMAVSDKG